MENQKDLNEIGGGSLPGHLEREVQKQLPILMQPVLDYMTQKFNEYNDKDVRFRRYQKIFLLSTMTRIVDDLMNNIPYNQDDSNDEETMMNEAKEKLKADFRKYL